MRLSKYDITLESITVGDIELIRAWRNQDFVRLNMEYQELITSEMQRNWFENLDKGSNVYFIIIKGGVKIGVVNLKNIHIKNGTAEAGIFIGEINHLNTLTPFLATITIMEFAFDILKLKVLQAKIASDNYKVILFNEGIGYEKRLIQTDGNFHYYDTDQQRFIEATKNMRSTLNKLNTKGFEMKISNDEAAQFKIN